MKPDSTTRLWKKRIQAARERRDPYEKLWQQYAALHTEGSLCAENPEKDKLVNIPGRKDMVKLGVIFRNIEQTLGYLDIDDIGVTARAASFQHQLNNVDTHNEAVVEQAIYNSLTESGLVDGAEIFDRIKLDALLCGHGVSYSWWRQVEEEIEVDQIQIMVEREDGSYEASLDKSGNPEYETIKEKVTIYENVRDERISPLEFLVSSTAQSIEESFWYGFERIKRIEDLKREGRYKLPKKLEGGTFEIKTLSGDRSAGTDMYQEDSVRVITIWDKITRELLVFLEAVKAPEDRGKNKKQDTDLYQLSKVKYPVKFDHPDDSPFGFFIPVPAADNPFGISQVEHIRNPAVEADILRSRRANLARIQKRFFMYDKNKIDQQQVDDALKSDQDMEAIGVDIQDGGDLNRLFKEVQTPNVPDALLQFASEPEETVLKNSGVLETPFAGADTATESEIQQMIGQARVNRKRNKMFNYLEQVARIHLCFLREFAPPGQEMRVTFADGSEQIMYYGREAFQGKFKLKLEPGGGPSAISPVRQKMLIDAMGIVGPNMGPKANLMLFREVLTQLDVRNLNDILQAAREHLLGAPAPGQAPPPGHLPSPQAGMPTPQNTNSGQVISQAVNPFG